jgi:hypothetical protein
MTANERYQVIVEHRSVIHLDFNGGLSGKSAEYAFSAAIKNSW